MFSRTRSIVAVSVAGLALGVMAMPAVSYAREDDKPRTERKADRRGEDRPKSGREDAQRPGPQMGLDRFDRSLEELELTEEQREKIQAIRSESREKFQKLAEQQRQLMQETRERINQVLTEEQKAKLAASTPARGRGFGAAAPGEGPTLFGRLESTVQELKLSEDQKTEVRELFAEYRGKFAKIREAHPDDPRAAMQEARPLTSELRSKINEVLTPEQREQLEQKFSEARGRMDGPRARATKPSEKPEDSRRKKDK